MFVFVLRFFDYILASRLLCFVHILEKTHLHTVYRHFVPHLVQPFLYVLHMFCVVYYRVIELPLGVKEVAVPEDPVCGEDLDLEHFIETHPLKLLLKILPVGTALEGKERTPLGITKL